MVARMVEKMVGLRAVKRVELRADLKVGERVARMVELRAEWKVERMVAQTVLRMAVKRVA